MAYQRRRNFIQKKVCRFCVDNIQCVDYKNIKILRTLITERGKIIPGRISGNCAKHQRMIKSAIKKSRNIALLPFSVER